MRQMTLFLAVAAMLLAMSGCSDQETTIPTAPGDQSAIDKAAGLPAIVPAHARPHGKTYGKWSELWWQWMASAPATPEGNPVLDQTGDLIDYGQSGPVWFVASSVEPGVVREASIPPGKSLFVCLAAFETSSWEGYGDTEEELRAAAAEAVDLITVTEFSIDGVAMPVGADFRVQSDGMFSLTVPEENVFDWWGFPAPAGTYYPSVADGYYVMLAPLSRGDHTVVIAWTFLDLVADLTIHLHVGP